MVGADGRVRVLDFGLSRLYAAVDETSAGGSGGALELQVTAAGSLLGTPAYMSPEQHERGEADARSDQFSFCVAVWEALYGQRPFAGTTMLELAGNVLRGQVVGPAAGTRVPSWLRRVLGRGLEVDPAQRWPTMDGLLAALARDPQRTRRRWLAAVLTVGAIAGCGYGAAAYQAAQSQVCSGAADELIGAWDGERRVAVGEAVRATGVAYAERSAATIVEHLDAYATRWVDVHASSCTSHQRGHMSPQLFDRRMACLRQRKSELAATTAVLGQTTRETVAQAVDTARGLPAVALCEDDARLLAAVASPEDPRVAVAVEEVRGRLARLQALERSGRYAEALTASVAMVTEAERLEYLPLRAEVELMTGKLLMHQLRPEARGHLESAMWLGLETHADAVAAEAAAIRVFLVASIELRPQEALSQAPLVWALLRRIGSPPDLVALLHNNVGAAWDESGEPARAIAAYEVGFALIVARAPDNPLRWALSNNLAISLNVLGDHARAQGLVRAALPTLEAEYDECHLTVANLRSTLAVSDEGLGAFDRAIAGHESAIACFDPDYPEHVVSELDDLGRLYLERGDVAQARRQIDRAAAKQAVHPELDVATWDIDMVRIDLALRHGTLAEARALLVALRAAVGPGEGTGGVRRDVLDTRLGLVAHREGDDLQALGHLQRAEQARRPGLIGRERGLHAFTLARVLRALGREPARVDALASEAVAAYATAGALYAGQVAEIRAWQAAAP